jgi:RNA polymerase sigma factor (sigma-70 family)
MKKPFRELAGEYRDRIYTYVFYSLQSREEAEDVTQEVLVKLWQHAEEIDPGRLDAWVMRVTRNAVIDAARRRRTKSAVFVEGADAEAVAGAAPPNDADAERALQSRELRDAIERALAAIEEPYRSIIVMREIQGMPYAEISDVLGMPLGTVKVYLHRGRRMLREALGGKV